MNDDSTFKVIIIGSGLAGSCLANGLLRADIDVRMYERLPKDTKREGYQIRLGAAALKGLRACLSPEQLESIVQKFGRASGLRSQAPVLYSERFEELINLTKFPAYSKSAPISRVVLRDLLAAPISQAGRLEYDKQFLRYEILVPETLKERVRVWFDDGSYDDCDVLIAADGAHSKINKQVGLDNVRQLTGYTSLVAKNELPTERFLELPPALALNPVLAFANNRALYFCAYLPEKLGQLGKYDQSLSSSFLGLHAPDREWPADMATLPKEKQWKAVSQVLEKWAPEYHSIVNLVKDCDMHVYKGTYSIEPSGKWRKNVVSRSQPERGHPRVWLIGDAMHAMLPNRGMGGNTAMYDTAIVLPLLDRLSRLAAEQGQVSRDHIECALKEYEDEMMPRAFGWVKKSGGGNVLPIDTSTMSGMAFIRIARVVLIVAGWWYSIMGLFTSHQYIDDAPELR